MSEKILLKYIDGTATEKEVEQVLEWIDANDKNMEQYLLLRKVYDASLWSDSIGETSQAFDTVKPNRNVSKIRLLKQMSKIAAIFILAIGCYHLLYTKYISNSDTDTEINVIDVPEGQRAELTLSDGTKVWLNAKSKIIFPSKFSDKERIVELTGEAYFDVTHDASKPFSVKASQYSIKVFGTQFNVKSYPNVDLFETALIEGSVQVTSKLDGEKIMLLPNDIVYNNKGKLMLAKLEDMDEFLWKQGVIAFDNDSFKEIVEKLKLYYDVEITVQNEAILTDTYTGKFWIKDGAEHVLKVLQRYHKFSYTKENMNQIIIF